MWIIGYRCSTFYLLLLVCGTAALLHVGLTLLSACTVPPHQQVAVQSGAGPGSVRPWWRAPSGSSLTAKLRSVGGVSVRGGGSVETPSDGHQPDPLSSLLASDTRYLAALARSLHQLMVDPATATSPPDQLADRLALSLARTIGEVGAPGRDEDGAGGGHDALVPAGTDPSLSRYWEDRLAQARGPVEGLLRQDGGEREPGLSDVDIEASLAQSLGAHGLHLGDGRHVDGRYSQQSCYMAGDEGELCVYDGVVCTDGSSVVLVTHDAPGNTMPTPDGKDAKAPGDPTLQIAAGARLPLGIPDPHSDCMDYRHSEASAWRYSSCRYDQSGDRPYHEALAEALRTPYGDPALRAARMPATDTPLDLTNRWYGPLNRRDVLIRPLPPRHVWPSVENGWGGVLQAAAQQAGQPTSHPAAPQLMLAARGLPSESGRVTVDWLHPAANPHLWLVPGATQVNNNPFFWMATGAAPLFAAQRSNASLCGNGPGSLPCLSPALGGEEPPAPSPPSSSSSPPPPPRSWGSHPLDGWLHPPGRGWEFAGQGRSIHRRQAMGDNGYGKPSASSNTARWVVGPQWGPLPSQDVVLFLGWGGVQTPSRSSLGGWYNGTLALAVQPHAQVYFNDLRAHYNETHLLCARRGAVTGSKPRLFSSSADAWMWRQYGYMATGLSARGVLTQSMYPPRAITIILRKGQHGRSIFNVDDVMGAVGATGLPVREVPRMDYLTFAEQVELMSGTGILIAPHGAALMNAMFLPAHAVVIELFPPLLRNNVFGRLAATMGQLYYPIHARTVLPANLTHMMGPALMGQREFARDCIATNISSTDAFLRRWCNQASKTHPVVVPVRVLKRVLTDAVDAIGAFSLLNPAWKALADAAKLPPPTRLELLTGDPDVEFTQSFNDSLAKELEVAARTTPVPVR